MIEEEALLDTGSDTCGIPLALAIEEGWLPAHLKLVQSVSGTRWEWVYVLEIEVLSRRWPVEAVQSLGSCVIIGRDVLNDLVVLFDGPEREVEVNP